MIVDKTYVSLSNIYDAEIKALAQAACDGMERAYMNGICAIVAQIESDLLSSLSSKSAETERTDE